MQHAKGPGSMEYPHGRVDKSLRGEGVEGYWLFQPKRPTPAEAPVILFVHGTRAMNPYDYGGWIEHLVRKGNVVIYPIFEHEGRWKALRDSNEAALKRALKATKEAIQDLQESSPIKLRLDRFAITGHSFGGGLSAQIAARAKGSGLPEPKAVMPVQPGWHGKEEMPLDALKGIPSTALVLILEGDRDQFEDTRQGNDIYNSIPQVPEDRKRFIVFQTDEHGETPLIADHSSPLAPNPDYGKPLTRKDRRGRGFAEMLTGMREGEEDVLDYLGYWKLFDSLCEAAFNGETIEKVVGTESTISMGEWSDGTPVKKLRIKRKP